MSRALLDSYSSRRRNTALFTELESFNLSGGSRGSEYPGDHGVSIF